MEKTVFTDPGTFPSDTVLQKALRTSYEAYHLLMDQLGQPPFSLQLQWNYYRDGKAWLGKLQFKKKTVCWISVYEGCFRMTMYLSAATSDLFNRSKLSRIIRNFEQLKPIGKLYPLVVTVDDSVELEAIMGLVRFRLEHL